MSSYSIISAASRLSTASPSNLKMFSANMCHLAMEQSKIYWLKKASLGICVLAAFCLHAAIAAGEPREKTDWPERMTINCDLPFMTKEADSSPVLAVQTSNAPAAAAQAASAPVIFTAPTASYSPEATPRLQAAPALATNSLQIRIYGYIKLDASYDTQQAQNGDYIYYVMPKKTGSSDNEFNMTAKETRLDLEIISPDIGATKISGKVEVDFYGNSGTANSPNVRMRLGYVDVVNEEIISMRAGQDWDTFMTVRPRMNNIAIMADAGALGVRRPQLRLSRDFKISDDTKIVAAVAAARTIGSDLDSGGQEDGVDAGFPSAQYNLYLETKTWTEKSAKVGVSGHWGMETMDQVSTNGSVIANDKEWYASYSVIGSLFLPLMKRVSLQGSVWQGQDLASYYGGIGQGINSKLHTAIAAQGGWAEFLIDLTQRLNLNLGYGLDAPSQSDLNAKDRSRNETFFSTLYYTVKPITFALEYVNMTTSYKDAASATDHRVQGSVIFTF